MFGCAWKINFPEIIFSWLCVLKALTRKWFEVKIFTSNHFWTHAQRERESLWLRQSTNRSMNPQTDLQPKAFDPPIYEPTNQSTNPRTDLRPKAFDLWAFKFAGDPEPSRHKPTNWSLSLSLCHFDFLCDFDRPTNRSMFLCDFDSLLSLFDL